MDDSGVHELALQLSDLEVAVLLCLASHEHCLVETTQDNIDDVAKELALISTRTFDLSYSIIECSPLTTLEELNDGLLRPGTLQLLQSQAHERPMTGEHSASSSRQKSKNYIGSTEKHPVLTRGDVVNVVIAKDFNHVNDFLQLHILQLLRSKQVTTQTTILNAPTRFLFIPLVSRDPEQQLQPPLNGHFNDHLYISHFHESRHGYVHLEQADNWLSDDQESISSVVRKPETKHSKKKDTQVSEQILQKLYQLMKAVTATAEVVRYQNDIVIFLRLSRAVAGGISVKASKQLSSFARFLALLNGTDFLTPSIVALAAKKVFRHRIVLARPEDDRSLEYGSDLDAVAQVLVGVSPELVLDSIISEVDAPV